MTDHLPVLLHDAMERATDAALVRPGAVDAAIRHARRRRAAAAATVTVAVTGAVTAVSVVAAHQTGPTAQRVGGSQEVRVGRTPAPDATAQRTAPPLNASSSAVDPPARDVLRALASKAAQQPDIPAGRFDFVKTLGWFDDGNVTAADTMQTHVDRILRRQWVASDGSGRIAESSTDARSAINSEFPAGGLVGPVNYPTDPSALRDKLRHQNPGESDNAAGLFDSIEQVWNIQAVTPALQAAVLTMLADEPGITNRGSVIDAAGRTGVAISADSDTAHGSYRDTLVLDPTTGMLLDDVQTPAPTALDQADRMYVVWLQTGRTDSTVTTP